MTAPAETRPRHRRPRRFAPQLGVPLAVGLAVGGPVSMWAAWQEGSLVGLLAFPVAMLITIGLWLRHRGGAR